MDDLPSLSSAVLKNLKVRTSDFNTNTESYFNVKVSRWTFKKWRENLL